MVVDQSRPPIELRGYQQECLDSCDRAWYGKRRPTGEGVKTRLLCVLPTGGGKTVIFAHLIIQLLAARQNGERVLVFVHRDELVKQAKRTLHSILPTLRIGVVKANQDEVDADVIICSIQTIGPDRAIKRRSRIKNVGLIVVDEAHHAEASTWRAALDHFGAFGRRWIPQDGGTWANCEPVKVAGFTATPMRADEKKLVGIRGVFEEPVFKRDILDLISIGALVDVVGETHRIDGLDLDEVKRSRGDMQAGDLGAAYHDADAGDFIARLIQRKLQAGVFKRPVVFAPTVDTTIEFTDEINKLGIKAEYITGETPEAERDAINERFRIGVTTVLVNCMVLTEGWDAPWADCAVIARPTESRSLFIQMVGRVLRPFPEGGKGVALVLNVIGKNTKHKLSGIGDLTEDDLSVDEGETLMQAKKRRVREIDELRGFAPEPKVVPFGRAVVEELDLFAASESMWLQTTGPRKLFFIPAGDYYFWLHPDKEGTFCVGRMPKSGSRARRSGQMMPRPPEPPLTGLTFEYAKAWAEKYAREEDKSISSKSAPWRSKAQPSIPQMTKIAGINENRVFWGERPLEYGVDFSTRGQASNAIAVHEGSKALDPE